MPYNKYKIDSEYKLCVISNIFLDVFVVSAVVVDREISIELIHIYHALISDNMCRTIGIIWSM